MFITFSLFLWHSVLLLCSLGILIVLVLIIMTTIVIKLNGFQST